MLALLLFLGTTPALSQTSDSGSSSTDSGSSTSGSSTGASAAVAPSAPPANLPADLPAGGTVTTGAYGQPLLPEGNPLTGLFTPQPQYVTPQTKMNDVPVAAGEANPIGKLFTYQNPKIEAPPGETNNMLQGAFTGQPQFATPQSQINPEPQAKFAIPGYGQANFEDLAKSGVPFKVPGTDIGSEGAPGIIVPGSAGSPAVGAQQPANGSAVPADKDTVAAKGKAVADDKNPSKDKDSNDDSTKTAGKDGDKASDKTAKDADASKDKTANAEDKDKKEVADKDKDTAKEEEKPKNLGPYSPLKDAIFFLNNGQYQQAVGIISLVLAKNPASAEAHYIAAVCFVGLRDFKMAADEYRLVLRLVPTTPLAQMSIEGLKKIRMPVTMSSVLPGKLPPLREH